jgi:hypothetical protein
VAQAKCGHTPVRKLVRKAPDVLLAADAPHQVTAQGPSWLTPLAGQLVDGSAGGMYEPQRPTSLGTLDRGEEVG